MSLSKEEKHRILQKIRSEYYSMSKESPETFKILPFEERYTQVLKHRGNLEEFFFAEMQHIREMKKAYLARKEKRRILEESPIDKLIEEQQKSMLKYPGILFHPSAKKEIQHFFGAVSGFVDMEIPVLEKIFKGTPEMKELQEQTVFLERIGYRRQGTLPPRIQDHVKLIHTENIDQKIIEKHIQDIVKDGCIALSNIAKSLSRFSEEELFAKLVLKFAENDPENLRVIYSDISYKWALDKVQSKANEIIRDFRMHSLLSIRK